MRGNVPLLLQALANSSIFPHKYAHICGRKSGRRGIWSGTQSGHWQIHGNASSGAWDTISGRPLKSFVSLVYYVNLFCNHITKNGKRELWRRARLFTLQWWTPYFLSSKLVVSQISTFCKLWNWSLSIDLWVYFCHVYFLSFTTAHRQIEYVTTRPTTDCFHRQNSLSCVQTGKSWCISHISTHPFSSKLPSFICHYNNPLRQLLRRNDWFHFKRVVIWTWVSPIPIWHHNP